MVENTKIYLLWTVFLIQKAKTINEGNLKCLCLPWYRGSTEKVSCNAQCLHSFSHKEESDWYYTHLFPLSRLLFFNEGGINWIVRLKKENILLCIFHIVKTIPAWILNKEADHAMKIGGKIIMCTVLNTGMIILIGS